MNKMSHYELRRLVLLKNINPMNFGGLIHMVLVVQFQGIRKNGGSTPTTTVSERLTKEKNFKRGNRILKYTIISRL